MCVKFQIILFTKFVKDELLLKHDSLKYTLQSVIYNKTCFDQISRYLSCRMFATVSGNLIDTKITKMITMYHCLQAQCYNLWRWVNNVLWLIPLNIITLMTHVAQFVWQLLFTHVYRQKEHNTLRNLSYYGKFSFLNVNYILNKNHFRLRCRKTFTCADSFFLKLSWSHFYSYFIGTLPVLRLHIS